MTVALLIILLISSLWTILVLRSAIVSLHRAGKSRAEIEEIKKGYSSIQRFFMLNVKDSSAGSPKYNLYRKNVEKFMIGYIIAMLFIWVLLIVAVMVPGMVTFVSVIIIGKAVLVDIALIAFYLKFNTTVDKKSKKVSWKWSDNK